MREDEIAKLELIRIKEGKETVLEVSCVPDDCALGSWFYPEGHIEKLEKHYKKTGKPKRSYIDAIYICRPQVERWPIELLEKYAPTLEAAKRELEKR